MLVIQPREQIDRLRDEVGALSDEVIDRGADEALLVTYGQDSDDAKAAAVHRVDASSLVAARRTRTSLMRRVLAVPAGVAIVRGPRFESAQRFGSARADR